MTWITKRSIVLVIAVMVSTSLLNLIPLNAESAQDVAQGKPVKLASIESITAVGEGDAKELVIKLSSPATYTSYKTTAPLRLVIDLSQTTQGTFTAPLAINKGNFKSVAVSRYDTDAGVLTRIDIELVKDSEAVLTASVENPGELRVSFPALGSLVSQSASTLDVPTTPVMTVEKAVTAPAVTPKGDLSSVPASASATNTTSTLPTAVATRSLTAISVKENKIILAIDGGAGEFKTFRLSNPDRYVVDLFDVKSALTSRIIPVNAAGVSSARLGMYPDKVRVVFDAISGSFPETSIAKTAEGLTLALNTKSAEENPNTRLVAATKENPSARPLESSTKVTPATESETVPSRVAENATPKATSTVTVKNVVPTTAATSVEMIDFQVVDGLSRVAVKVVGDISVEGPVKSPGFVTLTIKNASLPKNLQRSLETKGFVSPILRVTPILVKTRKGTDTKIRIAMRKAASFEYRREGDMLFVDFKNPESITADKESAELQEFRPQAARKVKTAQSKESELGTELASHAEPSIKPLDSSRYYKGRKVTLEFADAEVRKIFQLLSEVSNKNFVLGDDVTGSISIKLVNVPWDQALDIILDTKGLDKREDGNIIIIKGKGKFKSQAEEDLELKKQQYKAIELKSETFNVNYADLSGIVSQFTALKSERGAISPDARTNKVIVKDIPQVIEDMRKLLVQLDIPEKQVMIEARIVEATSTFTRSLGVNWGVHYRDGSASFMGINSLDTGFGGLTTAPPSSGVGTSSGINTGISFGTLTSNVQLDMRLSAAASAGLIKIVSTPKVATLNNKTAKITQGQQIPYTSSTSDKVETKFIEAALSLEVTPHINANGTIGMKIDAKNDSPGQATGGSTAPAINKKQATTEMLLRDGETTVIGGIYVDNDSESDDGVPFLMDIPLLGRLFKTNQKSKTKTELLIFVTPRILGTI